MKVQFRRPGHREMFSLGFLADVAAGRYPRWWIVGDLIHEDYFDGTHFVWRLGQVEPNTGWVKGVWPD